MSAIISVNYSENKSGENRTIRFILLTWGALFTEHPIFIFYQKGDIWQIQFGKTFM